MLSIDKKNYKIVAHKIYPISTGNSPAKRITLNASFMEEEARYIKIQLTAIPFIPIHCSKKYNERAKNHSIL